jgi:putative flippase GtrA
VARSVDGVKVLPMARAFLRYLITGSGMSAAIYLGYLGATALSISPALAISVIYPFAVGASYFLNRRFTFRSSRGHRESTWRFPLAHTLGYLLNVVLLWVVTHFTLIDYRVAEALVIVSFDMEYLSRGSPPPRSTLSVLDVSHNLPGETGHLIGRNRQC